VPLRILVTGATGFIGSYLGDLLHQKGDEVYGTHYHRNPLREVASLPQINLIGCDIRDKQAVDSLIQQVKPQRIYHLAAQSLPTLSWEEPHLTIETNVIGTVNLFEAVRKYELGVRVLVVCSSAEYGFASDDNVPIKEDYFLQPLHPYGVSKVAQDLLAYQYFINFKIPTVRIRLFNTTGPGKTDDVCSDFARQIAKVEKGLAPSMLKVGNLSARRDITDVRDVIKGLQMVLEQGEMGEVYNLSSGKAYSISDLLNGFLRLAKCPIEVEVSPELLRPTDEPIKLGDNTRICRQTGWQPVIPIEQTLEDILSYWREKES